MRSRKEIKENLSEMRLGELQLYATILVKNRKMGVTHLESMEENELQLKITGELINDYFRSNK